jgi:ligand-binding sensor domain-containing protein
MIPPIYFQRAAVQMLFLLFLIVGQLAIVDAEGLPIKTYTIADGLARDYVSRIVQDSHGFIWFCTSEGISRFDGYHFVNYGTKQGLPNRLVNDLLELGDGTYWLATGSGLVRFTPGTVDPAHGAGNRFVVFALDHADNGPSVAALMRDRAGVVWCGTENGLYRLEIVNGEWRASYVEMAMPAADFARRVHGLLEDRDGDLWVAAESGLYHRTPAGHVDRFTEKNGLPINVVTSILQDREGFLWAGTRSGLCRLAQIPDPRARVVDDVYTRRDGLSVSSLLQTRNGRLWIGTIRGLGSLDRAGMTSKPAIHDYTVRQGLSDDSIMALTEDRDGNVWIGSESGGAMKLQQGAFTTFKEGDGLSGERIGTIIEDQAGELCVITGGGSHLNLFDGTRFVSSVVNFPSGVALSWGWYQTTFQDHLGDWWLNTENGAYRYPRAKNSSLPASSPRRNYTTADGLPANSVFRQYEDARGDVWFGTMGNKNAMLARWSRRDDQIYSYTPKQDGLPPSAPTAYADDAAGNLWIGFYDGGLARYRDGKFTVFSKSDGLPDGLVRGLYLDHKKRLWVATSLGGVARVDETFAAHPRFSVLTSGDGLASDQVTCITEDEWGRIYLGTGRGLDRLDPETGHVKHYTSADGLPDNFINVSFRDRRGPLWFGTLRGLARLVPVQDPPASPPPILISSLRAGNIEHPVPELGTAEISSIELGPSENRIQAEFVSLSFSSGETLRYQYKLEGADKDWGAPTLQRTVNYANLAPGPYRFLVRAINADGVESAQPATISFRVLAPIWRRWWFIALVVLIVGALLFLLYRYRMARLREINTALMEAKLAEENLRKSKEERLVELERVRKRIATDLHDDIGSSLTRISLLSEVTQRQGHQVETPAGGSLSVIAGLSRELVDSMSDIVWAINPEKDRLGDLTQRMRHFASDVFAARAIDFRFRLPKSEHEVRVGANFRRELFLIFKEAVNNAVRHSGCTEAEIEFRVDRDGVFLQLSDNGHGFDVLNKGSGHGLASMHARTEGLGGKLEIVSDQGSGTKLTFTIPMSRQDGAAVETMVPPTA